MIDSSGRVVFGIDLSFTRTGMCRWDGESLRVGHFTSVGPHLVAHAQSVRSCIQSVCAEYKPDVIAVERPLTRAMSSSDLTGLWYIVMEYLLETGLPIVSIPPAMVRKIMGIAFTKGQKASARKAQLVERAKVTLGAACPPKIVHDEVDAFFIAYAVHRFWSTWKLGKEVQLSPYEREVWFSEDPTVKVSKNPRKIRKRAPIFRKKGVIYREGEFLFLPKKGPGDGAVVCLP